MDRTYRVEIVGKSPFLMHADDIAGADLLKEWRQDPGNAKSSVPGDDRSPAFTWIYGLYHDGSRLVIPSENIRRCLMGGGALVPVPRGRRGKTFKEQTQSGMMPGEDAWPLMVDGQPVPLAPISALLKVPDFARHQAEAERMGFRLYLKRATIEKKKHVRVRARFDRWSASGTIIVWDEQITEAMLASIFTYSGNRVGLGDWRPASPRVPGPFGRFDVKIQEA